MSLRAESMTLNAAKTDSQLVLVGYMLFVFDNTVLHIR